MGKGLVVVQYWYAYLYNDYWNSHEMDWETAMVVLEDDEQHEPLICALSAHHGGSWLPWHEVSKANAEAEFSVDGTHPIVYVASGSHANYFYGPAIYRTAPPTLAFLTKLGSRLRARIKPAGEQANDLKQSRQPLDYTSSLEEVGGLLVKARLVPEPVDQSWQGDWRWLNHTGRWGSPGQLLALGDAGPLGPPHTGDKWTDPLGWIDAECTRAPSQENVKIPTRWEY